MQIKNYNFGYFVNEKMTQKQRLSYASRNLPETFEFKLWQCVAARKTGPQRADRAITFATNKMLLSTQSVTGSLSLPIRHPLHQPCCRNPWRIIASVRHATDRG
jgi:hypothetical protein